MSYYFCDARAESGFRPTLLVNWNFVLLFVEVSILLTPDAWLVLTLCLKVVACCEYYLFIDFVRAD